MIDEVSVQIENEFLCAAVSPLGAELRSLYSKKTALSLLKSADDPYWDGISPILFPICGRLWEKTAFDGGKRYSMDTHGFARASRFEIREKEADRVVLTLSDNQVLRKNAYPYAFLLTVEYRLCGATLETRTRVENRSDRPMPYTVGFHPAFRIFGDFDDTYLVFPQEASPGTWRLTTGGYLLRGIDPLPLRENGCLAISRAFFAKNDSVFLENTAGTVTLCSRTSDVRIRLDYGEIPYLGLWSPAGASFLCIEPWNGCPDYDGQSTELSEKRDMKQLPAGECTETAYRITVCTEDSFSAE